MLKTALCLCLVFTAPVFELPVEAYDPAPSQKKDSLFRASPDIADRERPLWPGARFTEEDRARALYRGLRFIFRSAHNPWNFACHGHDYLWCFGTTAKVMKDPTARSMALSMGVELAHRWRRGRRSIARRPDVDTVAIFAFAAGAAEALGIRDDILKERIKRAASRFSAQDFLDFDPVIEPPPTDMPKECARCGNDNPRGSRMCLRCKGRLTMRSRYDVWCGALITTWSGDRYGVKLGACYADVLKWLPSMRPYRGREGGANEEFHDIAYAVTHVVYTLNDYSVYKLSPAWLPQEFEFLKASLNEALAMKDSDLLGELMDSLKSFGVKDDDPLMRRGVEYLLSHQNADGSWGHNRLRYHPTWTAIDGLSEYAWSGEGLSFPEVKPLLEPTVKEVGQSAHPLF